jgi:hypothetical protein
VSRLIVLVFVVTVVFVVVLYAFNGKKSKIRYRPQTPFVTMIPSQNPKVPITELYCPKTRLFATSKKEKISPRNREGGRKPFASN